MQKKVKAVVVDLDWTLCASHESRPKRYNNEVVNKDLRTKLNELRLKAKARIIILTGRKAIDHHTDTVIWLNENYILYDRLYMQEGWVAKQNHIYKEEILSKLKEEYDILMMYDDFPEVGKVCENLNIPFTLMKNE